MIEIPPKSGKAAVSIIWLHGVGAYADDMAGLAQALHLPSAHHVCLQAPIQAVTINQGMPMPAWFDITSLNPSDLEDIQGLTKSRQLLNETIDKLITKNQPVIVAGFSQGGALALYTSLQRRDCLATIGLSCYFPRVDETQFKCQTDTNHPIFLASGETDEIVHHAWSMYTRDKLKAFGLKNLHWQTYPHAHTVSQEEITDLGEWIQTLLKMR